MSNTDSLRELEKNFLTSKTLEAGHKNQIPLSLIKNMESEDSQKGFTFPLLIIIQTAIKRNIHYATFLNC